MNSSTPSLLDLNIDEELAKTTSKNVAQEIAYARATQRLYDHLVRRQHAIAALVRRHMGLGDSDGDGDASCIIIAPTSNWIHGQCNVCIPIQTRHHGKVLFRCPMSHKLPDVDEKMRSEVGTYVWMQENCPDVRIPHLYGFGLLSNNHQHDEHEHMQTQKQKQTQQLSHFTHVAQRPWYTRLVHQLKRRWSRLTNHRSSNSSGSSGSSSTLSQYTPTSMPPRASELTVPYMLLEYIEADTTGRILTDTWRAKNHRTPARMRNLQRSLARLMLSLARVPQPRIGSFEFRDDCTIALSHRPLICAMMVMENGGTPGTMGKRDMYLSTESFVSELLLLYERRLNGGGGGPAGMLDDDDDNSDTQSSSSSYPQRQHHHQQQTATTSFLRAVSHDFILRSRRNGPFCLQLTDLHTSNIVVDDDWNMTCLIDLEWISVLPLEMLQVPYWLTDRFIWDLGVEGTPEYEEEGKGFGAVRREFLGILRELEVEMGMGMESRMGGLSLARLMADMWDSPKARSGAGAWFWYAVSQSEEAFLRLVGDRVAPRYGVDLTRPVDGELLSRLSRGGGEGVCTL